MSGWTNECGHAFEAIKRYQLEPPILSSPQVGEELYFYLAMSDFIVSTILFQHNQSNEQRPVYYVSKALIDTETQHSQVEQMALALRIAAKKLHLYFQAH